ncbi:MAG: prepilin-type N-terminal cleavage/methylation domain-containing protein [candidate division Zixibacteria bacterium]|nr:prepilin-type N-terminal cleavage/methylation domain-containing protein [candidate division Zixibacteria bacterium]
MLKHFRNRKGFTLVEILIVVVMLAILFAIAVPIYISYVASARSAEAQEAINAIKAAAKVFQARNGQWPNNVQQMDQLLQFEEVTELRWTFNIVTAGQGLAQISATSLGQMPGGAGKVVTLDVRTGEWRGYGFDSN